MVERFTDNPVIFFLGCLVWIPIALWVVVVVNWMVQGEIDGIFGFISLAVALGLGYVTLRPAHPILSPLAFLGVLSIICCYPVVRGVMMRRELAKIDVEQIARIYESLQKDRENPILLYRLAELLHGRGFLGHAAALGNRIKDQLTPASTFRSELIAIQGWVADARSPDLFKPSRCPSCGRLNAVGEPFCNRCHEPHLLYVAKGMWAGRDLAGQVLAGLSVGLIALVGFPAVLTFGLPIWWVAALFLVMAAMIIFLVGRAFFHVFGGDG